MLIFEMAIKYIHYCIKMKNIITVLLITTALTLTNVPLSTNNKPGSYLDEIQTARILPDEIVFMLKDHSKFVYLNKIQGKIGMVVDVEQSERVVEFGYKQIQLLEEGKMKTFDIYNKTLWLQRPFKGYKDFHYDEIVGYLYSPPLWTYILTDKNIVKISFKSQQKQKKIEYIYNKTDHKDKTEKFKQLIRIVDIDRTQENKKKREEQKYILVSEIDEKESKQICMKLFEGKKSSEPSCFEIKKNSEYQMSKFRTGMFYVVMSDITYVVDESLKVKSKIAKKLISLSQQVLILEGGASFLSSKNSVSQQLVFESQQNKIYKLLVQDDKISMVQSTELKKKPIAQLQRQNKLKPINCWANQVQKQKYSQFELFVQWDDLSISFIHVSNEEAKSVWRIERISG